MTEQPLLKVVTLDRKLAAQIEFRNNVWGKELDNYFVTGWIAANALEPGSFRMLLVQEKIGGQLVLLNADHFNRDPNVPQIFLA